MRSVGEGGGCDGRPGRGSGLLRGTVLAKRWWRQGGGRPSVVAAGPAAVAAVFHPPADGCCSGGGRVRACAPTTLRTRRRPSQPPQSTSESQLFSATPYRRHHPAPAHTPRSQAGSKYVGGGRRSGAPRLPPTVTSSTHRRAACLAEGGGGARSGPRQRFRSACLLAARPPSQPARPPAPTPARPPAPPPARQPACPRLPDRTPPAAGWPAVPLNRRAEGRARLSTYPSPRPIPSTTCGARIARPHWSHTRRGGCGQPTRPSLQRSHAPAASCKGRARGSRGPPQASV